ncbi:MAG: hypothetical protein ACQCN6_11520 [Candidatus Bathyarchaeia archaeon]|jgi:hypothetical protein
MFRNALASTFKSKRFWIWQIGGAIIYAIPAIIRLSTANVVLPILGLLETPWIGYWIPGNIVEKILVNAFFPGAAGAIAGEIFFFYLSGPALTGRDKYKRRLKGALVWVTLWSLFQLWGNFQNIIGSYGGNLFEYPMVYPLNFLLASLSIFTPDIVGYLKNALTNAVHKKEG